MKAVIWFALALAAAGIAWEMPDDPPRVAGITGDASSAEASEAAREMAEYEQQGGLPLKNGEN